MKGQKLRKCLRYSKQLCEENGKGLIRLFFIAITEQIQNASTTRSNSGIRTYFIKTVQNIYKVG